MRSIALCVSVVLAGCGGGDGGDDDVVVPDAEGEPPDAEAPDGPPTGPIADFEVCDFDTDCENPASDCVPIAWNGNEKQCIPSCEATSECPFNTYCYPAGGGALGPEFALMGEHCWYSLCGEGLGAGSTTGGACSLGAESGVPAGDQLPGWCLPIEDQTFGQCLEAGDLGAGATCDFSVQIRGGANCDATTLCIASAGSSQGTCAQLCDPRRILSDEATGCSVAGEQCFDASNLITYADGSTARQTIGFCNDVTACKLIGANTCPNDGTGQPQGCAPTNSLRPTGICDPSGSGSVALGGACALGGGDSQECTPGALCSDEGGAGFSCDAICRTPPRACAGTDTDCEPSEHCNVDHCELNGGYSLGPDVDCAAINPAYTCQDHFWDVGADGTFGTTDDVHTGDFGTCR